MSQRSNTQPGLRGVSTGFARASRICRCPCRSNGHAKLDLTAPFPYPRGHSNIELATIEGQLLAAILGD